MKRKNVKGLALSAPPPKPVPSAGDAQIPGGNANDEKQDTLEIGVEFQLDLKAEDLIVLRELGSGNGGTVSKVQHAATKVIMARKVRLMGKHDQDSGGVLTAAGDTRGSQERSAKANCTRTPHHARLQLRLHRRLLWRLPKLFGGRHHVHGVHGCGVSRDKDHLRWPRTNRPQFSRLGVANFWSCPCRCPWKDFRSCARRTQLPVQRSSNHASRLEAL